MTSEAHLPLTSLSPNTDRLATMRILFPEVFVEGRIDFDRLKQMLGEAIQADRERYGLNWAGKANAIHALQSLSVGTLKPDRKESVNFDTTENLFIEGDNLEVLKLLQKSYFGKVKMIYLDPPYNTGNEFIYPDNFREGLEDYLRYSGQISHEGTATTSNKETNGRYHSKWLSMMYPRLFLAKNLLRDDGAIFISIDDNEMYNMRLIMNEVFGEENFVGVIKRRASRKTAFLRTVMSDMCDYIVIYSKNALSVPLSVTSVADDTRPVFNASNSISIRTIAVNTEARCADGIYKCGIYGETLKFELLDDVKVANQRTQNAFRVKGPFRVNQEILDRSVYITKDFVSLRRYLLDKEKDVAKAMSDLLDNSRFYNEEGSDELKELFGEVVFNHPKPSALVQHLIKAMSVESNDFVVLDFFAGSATTAQAVFQANQDDNGIRTFILVQLPEKTGNSNLTTIAAIGRERIRRFIRESYQKADTTLPINNTLLDLGFKAFRLAASNFKIWESKDDEADADAIAAQLELFADNLLPDATSEDILFEILLKAGYDLNVPREEISIGGHPVFSIAGGQHFICLEREITRETLDGMIERKPTGVICLDEAFHGDDALLTNTLLQMQDADIVFQTI
jgi:adenine-specific DNA-methyltransferase